jgi:hypothetical protein
MQLYPASRTSSSYVQTFSLAPFSNTLPLTRETKLHTHTKQGAQLNFCIFYPYIFN